MTKRKTAGVERPLAEQLMKRLMPSADALALRFCHEPADRVEGALETMRIGVVKDMAKILSPEKAEVFADHWLAIIRLCIAQLAALRSGAA